MKSKEQRYLELYEQVKTLVEVSETESRLARLFPQSQFNLDKNAKKIEKLKTKNLGKKGKYHSVIKMKRSSVVGKSDGQEELPVEQEPLSALNNGNQSPEESIRKMQDPMQLVQELLMQGMTPEQVTQYLQSEGMTDEEIQQILQQTQG
jgi:CRISPR/Cas system-associated protein Cas5 (RAMP superfamily)